MRSYVFLLAVEVQNGNSLIWHKSQIIILTFLSISSLVLDNKFYQLHVKLSRIV